MVYSMILLIRGEEEAAVEVDDGMDSCALTNISPPIPGASLLLVLLIVRITTLAMPSIVCYPTHFPCRSVLCEVTLLTYSTSCQLLAECEMVLDVVRLLWWNGVI